MTLVHVRVGALLVREQDVQPVARPARLVRAAVGRLHDAGTASGQDGETGLRQFGAGSPSHAVVAMILVEPGRPEHGDRRTHLEQALEARDELVVDPVESLPLLLRRPSVGKELPLVAAGATHRQFVAGTADLAPVLVPGLGPDVARTHARKDFLVRFASASRSDLLGDRRLCAPAAPPSLCRPAGAARRARRRRNTLISSSTMSSPSAKMMHTSQRQPFR